MRPDIIRITSGKAYRLDGYERYILTAVGTVFTALLEGQVQENLEVAPLTSEWISLATITSGALITRAVETPFIRVTTTSGAVTFHLQKLDRIPRPDIIKMISGKAYRLDDYEGFTVSAIGTGFTATLEGQVQENLEGATVALEWVTLAAFTDGTPLTRVVETPFIRLNVTSGTPSFHLQKLVRMPETSKVLKLLNTSGPTTPEFFGAIGDGITNDTGAWINALNSGNTIQAKKTYKIDPNVLSLPNGCQIEFVGAASMVLTGAGSVFKVIGGRTGINVVGGTYTGTLLSMALKLIDASGGRIENATLNGPAALATERTGNPIYSAVTDSMKTLYAEVVGCIGLTGSAVIPAIDFRFVKRGLAHKNFFTGYQHGIMWWGGDSNPGVDGALANLRKTENITITENTVTDTMGGIWGSMGKKIYVANNTVLRCSDVGIDFEGSVDGVATANVVEECVYACLATFFYNSNIIFSENTARQSVTGRAIINNWDYTQLRISKDIFYRDNILIGVGVLTAAGTMNGPIANVTFERNACTNVTVDLTATNGKEFDIRGNKFHYTIALPASTTAFKVDNTSGGFRADISNNTWTSSVTQLASTTALWVKHQDFSASGVVFLEGNKVLDGWQDATQMRVENASGNAGIYLQSFLTNNVLNTAKLVRSEIGARRGRMISRGNVDGSGNGFMLQLGGGYLRPDDAPDGWPYYDTEENYQLNKRGDSWVYLPWNYTVPAYISLGRGKTYTSTPAANTGYTDSGTKLTDGTMGADDYRDGQYVAWNNLSVVFVIDLGSSMAVSGARVQSMNQAGDGVYAPASVFVETSPDNATWASLATQTSSVSISRSGEDKRRVFTLSGSSRSARYIRFTIAKSTAVAAPLTAIAEIQVST